MTMQICTPQVTGFQHEDRVEADRSSQEGGCDVSHLEDLRLAAPTASCWPLRGLGWTVSSLTGNHSNQQQQMMEKLSLPPQIVASHVVISRDREAALRASQA